MLSVFNLEHGHKGREINFKNYLDYELNDKEELPTSFKYRAAIGDFEISNEADLIKMLKFKRVHKKRYVKDIKKIKYYEMGDTSKDERHDCHIRYNPYKCGSQSKWGKSSYNDNAKYRYEKIYGYSVHTFLFVGSKVSGYNNLFKGEYIQNSKRDDRFYGVKKSGTIYSVVFKDKSFESKDGYTKKYHNRYLVFFYKSLSDAVNKKDPIDFFELYYQHTKYPPASIWLILSIVLIFIMLIMGSRAFAMLRNQCQMNWGEFFLGRCGSVITAR